MKIVMAEKYSSPFRIALLLFTLVFGMAVPRARADPAAGGYLKREAILFKGTGRLSESALRSALPDSLPDLSATDTLEALQRQLHRQLGYYSSRIASVRRVNSPAGLPARLEVIIESGPPTRLGRLALRGVETHEEAGLLGRSALIPGAAVSAARVENTLREFAGFYADRGYPFCAARVVETGWDSLGRLGLTVRIERGPLVRIGRITIEGAPETRPAVVKRIAGLAEGAPYSESLLQRSGERLLASGLFNRAEQPGVSAGANASLADVHLRLGEYPAYRIEAALGAGGGESGGRGLAGLVRVNLANLFGSARSALIDWQRPRADWASLQLGYHEPWIAGTAYSLDAAFSQQVRDSLYTDTGARVGVGTELGDRLRVGLGAGYSKASPGSETVLDGERSTAWAMTGTAAWNNVRRPLNPSSGFEITLSGSVGRRRIGAAAERELRSLARFADYLPLSPVSHVLALLGGFGLVSRGGSTPAEIPLHARIPAGGVLTDGASVRGHIEEEVRARRAGWVNLEYRYLTGPASRLFAFYDLGAAQVVSAGGNPVLGNAAPGWQVEWLQGYGAGMLVDSRLGQVKISVAFSPEKGLGGGRLHVNLAEHF